MSKAFDFAIIGGGLAGSLLFAALKRQNPHLQIGLFEKNSTLCGEHHWCFQDADIPTGARPWLEGLLSQSWNEQEVLFPSYSRVLRTPYHCIKSEDLAAKLRDISPQQIYLDHELIGTEETADQRHLLKFENQNSIVAHSYILATNHAHRTPQGKDLKNTGWQKFVSLEVELESPHGLQRVLLRDVRQPQIDGYRFFCVLPLTETRLLIEDTYCSNHAILKEERIEKEILAYAERQGWEIKEIARHQHGTLPLHLQMSPSPEEKTAAGNPLSPPSLGDEARFVHPVTGHSGAASLRMIQDILDRSNLTMASLRKCIRERLEKESSNYHYLSLMNRLLFLATKNENRYKIFEKFYQYPEPLIDRFYAGKLTLMDRARIVMTKPPTSMQSTIDALRMKS